MITNNVSCSLFVTHDLFRKTEGFFIYIFIIQMSHIYTYLYTSEINIQILSSQSIFISLLILIISFIILCNISLRFLLLFIEMFVLCIFVSYNSYEIFEPYHSYFYQSMSV